MIWNLERFLWEKKKTFSLGLGLTKEMEEPGSLGQKL
jgi:hypothetical protein